jgi:hypothetical protein
MQRNVSSITTATRMHMDTGRGGGGFVTLCGGGGGQDAAQRRCEHVFFTVLHTTKLVFAYCCICVLVLLYMCPHIRVLVPTHRGDTKHESGDERARAWHLFSSDGESRPYFSTDALTMK